MRRGKNRRTHLQEQKWEEIKERNWLSTLLMSSEWITCKKRVKKMSKYLPSCKNEKVQKRAFQLMRAKKWKKLKEDIDCAHWNCEWRTCKTRVKNCWKFLPSCENSMVQKQSNSTHKSKKKRRNERKKLIEHIDLEWVKNLQNKRKEVVKILAKL
jgi:hypothetical protein